MFVLWENDHNVNRLTRVALNIPFYRFGTIRIDREVQLKKRSFGPKLKKSINIQKNLIFEQIGIPFIQLYICIVITTLFAVQRCASIYTRIYAGTFSKISEKRIYAGTSVFKGFSSTPKFFSQKKIAALRAAFFAANHLEINVFLMFLCFWPAAGENFWCFSLLY